jgi:putative tryptophan/tyrosine transport system substrate-binding protein
MIKSTVAWLLVALLLTSTAITQAQPPPTVPRIGYLHSGTAAKPPSSLNAFKQGLRDLGYVEGKNIHIEYRWSEYKPERLSELAAELVALNVDVIVTSQTPSVQAVQKATSTLPIVFGVLSFPVENGIIASFARPGGNATGLTVLSEELNGKRLELLKESAPKIARVGVFSNLTNPTQPLEWKEIESAAKVLGLKLQSLVVRRVNDFETVFKAALTERAQALINLPEALVNANFKRIAQFAEKHKLPTMFSDPSGIDVGGLMFYGPLTADLWRRAAIYVDKILKGAKPAELPVERPTKFEFIVNLKTAKQIGLTIPPEVLARANRIIR